jgi:hypothetical protein
MPSTKISRILARLSFLTFVWSLRDEMEEGKRKGEAARGEGRRRE